VNLLTAFAFMGGANFEDALVVSASAARKLSLGRKTTLHYGLPWAAPDWAVANLKTRLEDLRTRGEALPRKHVPEIEVAALMTSHREEFKTLDETGRLMAELDGPQFPWPARVMGWTDVSDAAYPREPTRVSRWKGLIEVVIEEVVRPAQVGDKLANLHGNKGVVGRVVPDDDMPRVKHPATGQWTTVDMVASPIGVINRGNFGQLAEAVASWMGDERVVDEDFPRETLVEAARSRGLDLDEAGRAEFMLNGGPKPIRAVVGWNFWTRQEQEAAFNARVCSTDTHWVPRAFAMTGVSYGEMEAWALGARTGARGWLEKQVLAQWSDPVKGDRERRIEAWALLARLSLGLVVSTRSEIDVESREYLIDGNDNRTAVKVRFVRPRGKEAIWPSWIVDSLPKVKSRHTVARGTDKKKFPQALRNYVGTLSQSFLGDWGHVMGLTGWPGAKRGAEALRRSPFVKLLLSGKVRPSARLVIVPDPTLELDQIRLPWWVAAALFPEESSMWRAGDFLGDGLSLDVDEECSRMATAIAKRVDGRYVVVHRPPVIHLGSMWPLRVVVSADAAPVAGLSLPVLPPMGADFDGDCIFMIPVNPVTGEGENFCRINAPVVRGDGGGRVFCHRAQGDTRSWFPPGKDLKAAKELSGEVLSDDDWVVNRAAQATGLRMLDEKGDVLGLGWWVGGGVPRSWSGAIELTEWGAAKKQHFEEQEDSVNSRNWWNPTTADMLVKVLWAGKRGQARVGGRYRTEVYRLHGSAAALSTRLAALQEVFSRLQEKMLKTKGAKAPADGDAVVKAWEAWAAGGNPALLERIAQGDEAAALVREVLDCCPIGQEVLRHMCDDLPEDHALEDLFCRGVPPAGGVLRMGVCDPRFILLREDVELRGPDVVAPLLTGPGPKQSMPGPRSKRAFGR
jgi:hypothetical protein